VPDGVTREFLLGFDATTRDWTFPVPGNYRLVVEYQEPTGGPRRSNVVTVTVQAPTGPEQEVRDRLRELGPELVVAHESEPLGNLESLAQDHPQSAYLQERRWRDLDSRMGAIAAGYEPTEQYLDPPSPQNHLPDVAVARARGLLPLALEVGEVPGQFQPDVLLKLGHLFYMAGEPERALEVFERVVREFPDREAARIARGAVGDHSPPTLTLAASPATLWPPNKRLVSVTVAVTVNDDMDSSPAVALVSITCNDSCNAAQDIAGATLNTDDRTFQLLAWRTGSGSGRTYTVTYSATDASGNSTTAKTVVTVRHDQGH
jgi:hypothetical protein